MNDNLNAILSISSDLSGKVQNEITTITESADALGRHIEALLGLNVGVITQLQANKLSDALKQVNLASTSLRNAKPDTVVKLAA